MIKVRICWEFDYIFWHLSTSLSISFICICNNYSCIVNQRHLGYNCPDFVSGKGSDSMYFQSKRFRHRIKQEREDLISCFHPLILKKCPEIFPQNDLDSLCTHPAEGYKWYEKEIQYRRRRGGFQYCRFITFATIVPQMDGEGRAAQWKYLCVCAIVDIPIVCTCLLQVKYLSLLHVCKPM